MRSAHRADNSAVLVVPNIKVRVEAQRSTTPLSPHDLILATTDQKTIIILNTAHQVSKEKIDREHASDNYTLHGVTVSVL